MSLSKELCLRSDSQNSDSFSDCFLNEFQSNEDNYRRDSFDDRFCDDLCEDILQYLSLEDKLRLQCVSKQFQRTVFQRQYELYIDMSSEEHKVYTEEELSITNDHNYYYIEDQNLDFFKAVLKKCPNITSIQLDGSHYTDREKVNQVFRLIIENCNNLSEVFVLNYLNDSNFEELHQKFGSKVKYLRFYRQITDLSLFPNIEKVKINYGLKDESRIPQLKLANLKQLDIELHLGQEHLFQTFIDKFATLTHFNVLFYTDRENAIYRPLKSISNLKHLIHFKLHNQLAKNNENFCDLLKQMGNICQNLKSIDSCFVINDKNSNIRQFLSQLKTFPALKRLKLWLHFIVDEDEDNIDVNQLFSFELFKGFENITHLTLRFVRTQTLNESILKDIDINLPNLQYLEIEYRFLTTSEGLTEMADILSRLSRLEILKLEFISGVDFQPIEKIPEKCRKIKKIEIKISYF